MLYTTLEKIESHDPCRGNYQHFLETLGKDVSKTKKINVIEILNHSKNTGLPDLLWCFDEDVIYPKYKAKRIKLLFMADIAERVLLNFEKIYPNDDRIRKCIQGKRDYANKIITKKEYDKLIEAGESAIYSASWTDSESFAWYAARYAARYASITATGLTLISAVQSAVWSAWSVKGPAVREWLIDRIKWYLDSCK